MHYDKAELQELMAKHRVTKKEAIIDLLQNEFDVKGRLASKTKDELMFMLEERANR